MCGVAVANISHTHTLSRTSWGKNFFGVKNGIWQDRGRVDFSSVELVPLDSEQLMKSDN